jgi:ABC-type multidrug transport system ATPase subunit
MKIANNVIEDYYAQPELMRGKVGYCPQTDPLIDVLTVRENLEFYAQL